MIRLIERSLAAPVDPRAGAVDPRARRSPQSVPPAQEASGGSTDGNFIEASDFPFCGISVRFVSIEFFIFLYINYPYVYIKLMNLMIKFRAPHPFCRLGVYTFGDPLVGRRGCLHG